MNSAAVTASTAADRLDGYETPDQDSQSSGGPIRSQRSPRCPGAPYRARPAPQARWEPRTDLDVMRPVQATTPQQRRNTKSTCWMGVHNNPDESDTGYLTTHVAHMKGRGLRFFMYAREHWTAEERAEGLTPHVHYLLVTEPNSALRFDELQRTYPGVHWMMKYTKASVAQCVKYMEKEGDFVKEGTEPADRRDGVRGQQGRRTDLAVVAAAALEHGMDYVVQNHPAAYVQYNQGLTRLLQRQAPRRSSAPLVVVLWGGTGTGKSFRAREELKAWGHDEDDIYVWHPQQGTWFDGYEGQQAVILEEFRGQLPFGMLLSMLDKYCCRVQHKGSSGQFTARRIYITSPVDIDQWYPELNERVEGSLAQLKRRINRVHHLAIRHVEPESDEPLYPPGFAPGDGAAAPPSSPR